MTGVLSNVERELGSYGFIFVVPAQFHGGVHAVFPRHLNIQKRHRVNGLIVLKELLTVTKPGNIELLAKLGGVPLYVCRQVLSGVFTADRHHP